jgi:signal peptidase I
MRRLYHHRYVFIFTAVLIVGGSLIPTRFAFTTTVSLNHRIFFLKHISDIREIAKHDYVMFPMHTKLILEGKEFTAIKQVTCDAGDKLEVKGKDYFCNGKSLGSAKSKSLRGEPLTQFVFNGAVPSGMLFVTGHHKDSYDSRYFGFVRREDVKAIAHPII